MTPIERAARALCENPSEDPDEIVFMTDGTWIPRWKAELWRVKAVLQAIREPSEAMAKAGADDLPGNTNDPLWVAQAWTAMIDKALEEG